MGSNLRLALNELIDPEADLEQNYDAPSCMRSRTFVKALLECARFLDEQDLDGLNSFQLDFHVMMFHFTNLVFKTFLRIRGF